MTDKPASEPLKNRVAALESAILKKNTDESELRLMGLIENAIKPLRDKHFDSYKAYTTILFTALALLFAVSGILSRIEIRDQLNDFQQRFDKQASGIQSQFDKLAGEALKRPRIEIIHDGSPLEGQTIEVPFALNSWPQGARLGSIFIRNLGERITDPVSIQISVASQISIGGENTPDQWEQSISADKRFQVNFTSLRHPAVHPGETLNVHPIFFYLDRNKLTEIVNMTPRCRISVYYGGLEAAEAFFNIVFKPHE